MAVNNPPSLRTTMLAMTQPLARRASLARRRCRHRPFHCQVRPQMQWSAACARWRCLRCTAQHMCCVSVLAYRCGQPGNRRRQAAAFAAAAAVACASHKAGPSVCQYFRPPWRPDVHTVPSMSDISSDISADSAASKRLLGSCPALSGT
eukprot:351002-Chlamydomonas_euryale.AAC.14